jgi:hypothetical protein
MAENARTTSVNILPWSFRGAGVLQLLHSLFGRPIPIKCCSHAWFSRAGCSAQLRPIGGSCLDILRGPCLADDSLRGSLALPPVGTPALSWSLQRLHSCAVVYSMRYCVSSLTKMLWRNAISEIVR